MVAQAQAIALDLLSSNAKLRAELWKEFLQVVVLSDRCLNRALGRSAALLDRL